MLLTELLEANREFVQRWEDEKEQRQAGKVPAKKLAIFSCMDTRLVEMLDDALGLRRGEAKVIKNAGTALTEDVVRSLAVAVYLLGVQEVVVIAHLDCGMSSPDVLKMEQAMIGRGVDPAHLEGIDLNKWLQGFGSDYAGHVREVTEGLRAHPLLPKDIPYHGMLFCPDTGHLELIVDGYQNIKGAKAPQ